MSEEEELARVMALSLEESKKKHSVFNNIIREYDERTLSELGVFEKVERIVDAFPGISRDYVASLLVQNIENDNYESELYNSLSEKDDYPREKKQAEEKSKKIDKETFEKTDTPISENYKRLMCSFISLQYPRVPLRILLKEATKHNFHLYPTMLYLLNNLREVHVPTLHYELADTKAIPFLPYPRVKDLSIELFDDAFFAEASFVNDEQARRRRLAQAKFLAEAQGGSLLECVVCVEEIPMEEFVSCSEQCMVCAECVAKYLQRGLEEGKANLKCMVNMACTGTYVEAFLQKCCELGYLPEDKRRKIDALVAIAATKDLEGEKCPQCSYMCIMDNPNDVELRCKNINCMLITCRRCKKKSHVPLKCDDLRSSAADKCYLFIEKYLNDRFTKRCPHCGFPGIKDSGCDFVYCRCGKNFCSRCYAPLTEADHTSAAGSHLAQCRAAGAVVDNEEYKKVRIEALAEWKRQNPGFAELNIEMGGN